MNPHLLERLAALDERFEVLIRRLGEPEVIADRETFRTLAKERAELQEMVGLYRRLRALEVEIGQGREVLAEAEEAELRELAREEVQRLEGDRGEVEARL
jgi:peptide chain release factor 1